MLDFIFANNIPFSLAAGQSDAADLVSKHFDFFEGLVALFGAVKAVGGHVVAVLSHGAFVRRHRDDATARPTRPPRMSRRTARSLGVGLRYRVRTDIETRDEGRDALDAALTPDRETLAASLAEMGRTSVAHWDYARGEWEDET